MKKGFTLVEMLVVVVVIVTLMTMTFRLSSIGDDTKLRNRTIDRLNRVENCLSGYYAAFGSYPQVALHGSRNIYARVNGHGIQSKDQENTDIWSWKNIGDENETRAWAQVKAACKSQPVDCRFPFPSENEYNVLVQTIAAAVNREAAKSDSGLSQERKSILTAPFDNGVTDNRGRHDSSKSEWQDAQLFKFGLMSYLLPRYLVMMNTDESFFTGNYQQWLRNNEMPCDPMKGDIFPGWQVVREYAEAATKDAKQRTSRDNKNLARVANIPSQAVTARWMPNLEGIVCCNHDYNLFGIKIRGDNGASELRADNLNIEVYSPGGYEAGGNQYVLDSVTVLDGWWHQLYYYSPPPYQNYTLWSGGPNDRTFPPWISRKSLSGDQNKKVALWVEDDIVRMSN